jgi:1,4-dihydroxy-2-naphthoyl-CoA hydrolase
MEKTIMSEHATPTEFLAQAQERIRGTFIELVGIRLVELSDVRAVAEMTFADHLRQLTGVFHAGTLISLADTTATFGGLYWTLGAVGGPHDPFPFTIQLSTNFIRNTGEGTVRAESRPIHRGRTTLVVETRITDSQGRLLIVVTTTHLNRPA